MAMGKVTKESSEKTAKLALLSFNEAELSKFTEKFSSILEYVNKLKELDTKNISPTSHAVEGVVIPLREDVARPFENVDGLLSNVPSLKERLVEVPKVIEED